MGYSLQQEARTAGAVNITLALAWGFRRYEGHVRRLLAAVMVRSPLSLPTTIGHPAEEHWLLSIYMHATVLDGACHMAPQVLVLDGAPTPPTHAPSVRQPAATSFKCRAKR